MAKRKSQTHKAPFKARSKRSARRKTRRALKVVRPQSAGHYSAEVYRHRYEWAFATTFLNKQVKKISEISDRVQNETSRIAELIPSPSEEHDKLFQHLEDAVEKVQSVAYSLQAAIDTLNNYMS